MQIMCAFWGLLAFALLVHLFWFVGYLLEDRLLEPTGRFQTIMIGGLFTVTGVAIVFGFGLLLVVFYEVGCFIHSLV